MDPRSRRVLNKQQKAVQEARKHNRAREFEVTRREYIMRNRYPYGVVGIDAPVRQQHGLAIPLSGVCCLARPDLLALMWLVLLCSSSISSSPLVRVSCLMRMPWLTRLTLMLCHKSRLALAPKLTFQLELPDAGRPKLSGEMCCRCRVPRSTLRRRRRSGYSAWAS